MVRFMQWDDVTRIDWANPHADSRETLWGIPTERMKQELLMGSDVVFQH